MISRLKKLYADEEGAVTVDWVVLTSLVLAFNIALVLGFIETGVNSAASSIYEELTTAIDQW